MVEAYAVIGANYGDEGKGLVTNKLCRDAFLQNKSVLNVLTNGGCQRGHTAYDSNGNRHVYHHFGSGYPYADIYFSKFYLVNPMIFMEEYNELSKQLHQMNAIYIDDACTLTTPYDMLINRISENNLGENRHGSCGYGINETIKRNKYCAVYWKDIKEASRSVIVDLIKFVREDYFWKRLELFDKVTMTPGERTMFDSEIMLENYVDDIIAMRDHVLVESFDNLSKVYDVVVFENAQGLLLDKDRDEWGTPTKTGMAYIKELTDFKVVPYYVTRSYLTKHGNGDFDGECSKDEINPNINDLTNQPNDYQGELRYGKFDKLHIDLLRNRIRRDSAGYDYKVVVTHRNEFICPLLDKIADYDSYNETDFIENPNKYEESTRMNTVAPINSKEELNKILSKYKEDYDELQKRKESNEPSVDHWRLKVAVEDAEKEILAFLRDNEV